MEQNKNLSTEKVREALAFQNLSPEEKESRGILGRLYGPCASIISPTRNGRLYNDELWENVFNKNEIVKEMFDCGGIPMELDHPKGEREETDSENIAAILPERPKKDKDGHLITYVDILNTPKGRIVYTLAKYGFKWGISSRGSGEVDQDYDGNEAVNPETYDFQTFDLVLLPAVKDARLTFVEDYDIKQKNKLKKMKLELREALNSASAGDRKIMEKTLDELEIKLDDEQTKEDQPNIQTEEAPLDEAKSTTFDLATAPKMTPDGIEIEYVDIEDFKKFVNESLTEAVDDEADEEVEEEDEAEVEETEAEAEAETEDENAEEVDEPKNEFTVKEIIDAFKEFDNDATVKVSPLDIDGKVYDIDLTVSQNEDEEIMIVGTVVPQDDVIDQENELGDEAGEEIEVFEDQAAEDDGAEDDEIIENFKQVVREKKALEDKIKSLTNEKTVSDAKVEELNKELVNYKEAFERTSKIAAQVKKNRVEIKNLNEKLLNKEAEIKHLTEAQAHNKLNESLDSTKAELEKTKKQLVEQAAQYQQKFNDRTELAKKYKSAYVNVLQRYVESKASMLNVKPVEITNKLDKNYTIDDVDKVCDEILNEGISFSNLPLNTAMPKVRFSESFAQKAKEPEYDCGYEIADWALDLANLNN